MSQVSRPMMIALLGTVLFAGVWLAVLRPKPGAATSAAPPAASTPAAAPSAPGVNGLTNAIGKAQQAVGTANGASQAHGGTIAPGGTPAGGGSPASQAGTPHKPAPSPAPVTHTAAPVTHAPVRHAPVVKHVAPRAPVATGAVQAAEQALVAHKVLVLLFHNPAAADDRAVLHEVRSLSTRGGRIVVVTAPASALSRFADITRDVQVEQTPTVLFVDRQGKARTIVGFADGQELQQRADDALAAH